MMTGLFFRGVPIVTRQRLWIIAFLLMSTLFIGPVMLHALAVYKYTDKQGTVHFVEDPNQIPPDYRKNVKKIEMKGADEKKGDGALRDERSGKKELVEHYAMNLMVRWKDVKIVVV